MPMPTIHSPQPALVQSELFRLRTHLDANVPGKQDGQNVLIATWNIRSFGSLTRKWTATSSDSPKRDLRGLLAISEIIKRFDVVAIQEVKGNLRSLRDMLKYLGDDWAFLMTDITLGDAGNKERMAFLFDRTRVRPSGLACELVVPPEWLSEVAEDALTRQFVRTPYAVSFRSGKATFILVTLHVDYGKDSADRVPELKGIARWMRDWADRSTAWHHNLIALGDFNIDRQGDKLWKAFTSTGLASPPELDSVPRTIFGNQDLGKFYDQISWFRKKDGSSELSMKFLKAGYVDFRSFIYTEKNFSNNSLSYRLSDHYPLWTEFSVSSK